MVDASFVLSIAGLDVSPLDQHDHDRLAALCRECTEFFELVEGMPGGAEVASNVLGPLPSNVTGGRKSVFGLERAGTLIGLLEILEGFPAPDIAYVGLLLLHPAARGTGLGTRVWAAVSPWLHTRGATTARVVVQHQNPSARRFWERQGFTVEANLVARAGRLESPVWRLSRGLGPRA